MFLSTPPLSLNAPLASPPRARVSIPLTVEPISVVWCVDSLILVQCGHVHLLLYPHGRWTLPPWLMEMSRVSLRSLCVDPTIQYRYRCRCCCDLWLSSSCIAVLLKVVVVWSAR